jgi:hypothetical protein
MLAERQLRSRVVPPCNPLSRRPSPSQHQASAVPLTQVITSHNSQDEVTPASPPPPCPRRRISTRWAIYALLIASVMAFRAAFILIPNDEQVITKPIPSVNMTMPFLDQYAHILLQHATIPHETFLNKETKTLVDGLGEHSDAID